MLQTGTSGPRKRLQRRQHRCCDAHWFIVQRACSSADGGGGTWVGGGGWGVLHTGTHAGTHTDRVIFRGFGEILLLFFYIFLAHLLFFLVLWFPKTKGGRRGGGSVGGGWGESRWKCLGREAAKNRLSPGRRKKKLQGVYEPSAPQEQK